ncbi:putative beta-glucosidase [Gordonia araii NBRC 100433]|uniref:Putative beta-glucosidase n=1 Tax=Gordonia araii NBRC 100433 TaxID=1073574 RepID=G7GZI1_9ACTN|nr:family 1 glycosylhydrolase [Gordonia araii]NNG97924.1 glycoside hydrolase family 1 protein [Gordonia araii NBRC 100433]GAB09006.1 putative beta-glucosidase [Gordonia araii NBRC 100433]
MHRSARWGIAALAAVVATAVMPATSQAAAPLPPGFLWGVASSGFQSEGSPGGKPASNWTVPRSGQTPIGRSVDFRNRYRSDIALARGLGVKVYRVGVEWARVQPSPTRFDEREWAYYDDMIGAIVAAGMRPMITIDHWVYPQWMMRAGGWTNPASVRWWLRYANRVVHRFAKFDPMWVTFNEPVVNIAQQLSRGELPPSAAPTMADRMVEVNRRIYREIHRIQPRAMVTSNSAYIPAGGEPLIDPVLTDRFMRHADYVGVDNYYGFSLGNPLAVTGALRDGMAGLPVSADSIYYALRYNARRYPGKPIYVVESGMPTADGKPRSDGYRRGDHLADLIYWVQRARAAGIPVIGYNYWSLTDNYEWGSFTPRFGLYTVNVERDRSLRRIPTDAVPVYRRIISRNGVAPSYRPTRPAEFCSIVEAAASCLEPVR